MVMFCYLSSCSTFKFAYTDPFFYLFAHNAATVYEQGYVELAFDEDNKDNLPCLTASPQRFTTNHIP